MRINKPIFVLLVISLVCVSVTAVRLLTGYNNLCVEYNNLSSYTTSLQTQLTFSQQENTLLQQENISFKDELITFQDKLITLQQENILLQRKNTSLQDKLKGTLPYSKANGTSITLENNFGNVHNPTWAELKSFLKSNKTEEYVYSDSYVCGDFAEALHNSAEAVGIRTALVVIDFEEDSEGHALNAFYTADRGLVYIDDTGEGLSSGGEDKVAYIVKGKEYGLIRLDIASSPSYAFYENYMDKWTKYDREIIAYNQEVNRYNQGLGWRYFLEEPEYSYFMNWYNRLEARRLALEADERDLGYYYWESLGVVTEIEIFW